MALNCALMSRQKGRRRRREQQSCPAGTCGRLYVTPPFIQNQFVLNIKCKWHFTIKTAWGKLETPLILRGNRKRDAQHDSSRLTFLPALLFWNLAWTTAKVSISGFCLTSEKTKSDPSLSVGGIAISSAFFLLLFSCSAALTRLQPVKRSPADWKQDVCCLLQPCNQTL